MAHWNSADLAPKKPTTPRTPAAHPDVADDTREAGRSQEITFLGKVPGNNGAGGLLRMHWRARGKLADDYQYIAAMARLQPMAGPIRLELVRYSTGRPSDFDNLVSTGKLILDAIVKAGILPDDNPAVIAERSYTQERAASKDQQRTVIRLIPL